MSHRASPEFMRSRKYVAYGIHYRETARTGTVVLKLAQQTGASYSANPIDQLMRSPLFPHLLLLIQWAF